MPSADDDIGDNIGDDLNDDLNDDIGDEPGATIRCQGNASVGVTFRDRFSFDADSAHFAVELRARV
ncbi:hypothetical protein ACIBCM_25060 [Streptomyces sp. NPDC051018]|uniref:hypothetical protein n=1 Tax=Streptomyces sp. NPDC051018 TaxID=3365639 RepID=UPI0037B7A84F